MRRARRNPDAEITNWKFVAIAFAIGLVGLFLVYRSNLDELWVGNVSWQRFWGDIGAVLVGGVALALIWELIGKRTFLREVLSRIEVAEELAFAGIAKVADSFHDSELDWSDLFKRSYNVDLFFAYAGTWRKTHGDQITEFHNKGGQIRLVLPDPDDQDTMSALARRFSYQVTDLIRQISDTADYFRKLDASTTAPRIKIWFIKRLPLLSFYIFDYNAVMAIYSNRGRTAVPTFLLDNNGHLYQFIKSEFEFMIGEQSPSRQVHPTDSVARTPGTEIPSEEKTSK